jgi:surface antigen
MSMGIAKSITAASVLCAALMLTACNSTSATRAEPVAAAVAPLPPTPGVVGSTIGQTLDEGDKQTAIAAQHEAVNSGARKTWKGAHGAYGFIAPGPEGGMGGCRDYTHKIFIDGRPQEAKGQACRAGDGSWRVSS